MARIYVYVCLDFTTRCFDTFQVFLVSATSIGIMEDSAREAREATGTKRRRATRSVGFRGFSHLLTTLLQSANDAAAQSV
jgi:hypothetical protein